MDGSYKRWNDPENGTWKVKVIQCKQCEFNQRNPMICTKFPDRKPSYVLKCEKECPEFNLKKD